MKITPARTLLDKIGTISIAFLFIALWVNFIAFGLRAMGIMPPGGTSQVALTGAYAISFFFSNLWAPLWEELVFRLAPIELARALGEKTLLPIVIMSSYYFGFGHGHGPFSLLMQGAMGLTLCWVYLRNGYWSAVLVHAMWNIFVDFYP